MVKPPHIELPELPRLTDIESAEACQQQIMDEVHSGQLSEKVGAVLNRGVENWGKLHDSKLDRHHLKELTALVGRLEAENKKLKAELAKRGGLRVTA